MECQFNHVDPQVDKTVLEQTMTDVQHALNLRKTCERACGEVIAMDSRVCKTTTGEIRGVRRETKTDSLHQPITTTITVDREAVTEERTQTRTWTSHKRRLESILEMKIHKVNMEVEEDLEQQTTLRDQEEEDRRKRPRRRICY